jgi:hypothetical protein
MANNFTELKRDIYFSILIAILFTFESWILGPISWIYGYGSGLETIPALKALSFGDRNLSFWSPFVAGGIDRLAFWGNANPFGPEFFLFKHLPTWLANGLHRFLQYFIASYFTIRVALEQLYLRKYWAILTAILFASFSYYTVGALFTLPGIPLVLWLLDHSLEKNNQYIKSIFSGIIISFTTTFTFGVPYLLLFSALWCLLVSKKSFKASFWPFTIFTLTLIIATSPQLFAIALNGAGSHRANWEPEVISFSLDGAFYRQLQFDLFGQNSFLMMLTMNLPMILFIVGAPAAWMNLNKSGELKNIANKYLLVIFIFLHYLKSGSGY